MRYVMTSTVGSIRLIASSIMSKNASGADAIALDVKVGTGAFMKILMKPKNWLRQWLNGNSVGRDTMAVISDMSQPLEKRLMLLK